MTRCPFCAEDVRIEALKCKHCGSDLGAANAGVSALSNDTTVAILAYVTLIGFIVAVVLHQRKKTELGSFHLRQSLGLLLVLLAALIPILGPLILVGLLVLWVFGVTAAANGQMKPVPVLGELFQKWFATAFQ
jgi:uncharacterized membrane protein